VSIPYSSVFYKTVLLLGPAIPVCSTNKTDRHDITEILLKVAFNTLTQKYVIRIKRRLPFRV